VNYQNDITYEYVCLLQYFEKQYPFKAAVTVDAFSGHFSVAQLCAIPVEWPMRLRYKRRPSYELRLALQSGRMTTLFFGKSFSGIFLVQPSRESWVFRIYKTRDVKVNSCFGKTAT